MSAVPCNDLLFQGSRIHAHADRNIPGGGCLDHSRKLFLSADIAGVNAYFIRAVLNGCKRQAIVKMDIRNQRDPDLMPYLIKRSRGVHIRYRYTDDLTACLFKTMDLFHRSSRIRGFCIAHGLDRDRMRASDHNAADIYFMGMHSHVFPPRIL